MLSLALIAGYIALVVDAYKLFGLGWSVAWAAAGVVFSFLLPILMIAYLFMRANKLERMEVDPNWQRDLARMQRGEMDPGTPKDAPKPDINYADRDPAIDDLIEKKDAAGAMRLAKERAAQALSAKDFAAARVYERYLERIRRGIK